MPTPPTLVAFAEAEAAVASGAAVTTASVSWQTGDVVVVFAGTEGGTGGETIVTPTTAGSGISFGAAKQIHNSTGSDCGGACYAAVASATSSGTFAEAATHSASTRHKVIGAYVFRGSAGIGNSNIYTGVSPTGCSLTPTGADGSAAWVLLDWGAVTPTAPSPTATTHGSGAPGPTASPVATLATPSYTYYIADLDDQTSAGAVSYGITGTGTGPFTIIAIEVKSAAGGSGATVTMGSALAVTTAQPAAQVMSLTSPAYAATATDLGGGAGSWTSPANAQGTGDGSFATWTAP